MELLPYLPRSAIQDDEQVRAFVELFGADPPWGNPGRLGQWEATVAWTSEDQATIEARWSRISVPVLAVAFEHDIDSPPAHARRAIAHVPDARIVEIPDATHLGPFEQPDAVAAALTTFFTGAH
jgi:pimeloyl-ACP methyl ester carboxylesterase